MREEKQNQHTRQKPYHLTIMWQTKRFKTRQAMENWLANNSHNVQWEEIFVNNGYGLTYRKLRIVH